MRTPNRPAPAAAMLLTLTLAATTVPAADAPAPPADARLTLFLLIGQSNMAGRGKVEAEDRVPHPRVWVLDKDDRWAPAVDPLHFDKPKVAGVGLGLTFGRTLADADPAAHVGLIPCAVGGTSIEQWRKGGELYENAVRRARLAAERGTIAGILWHQGEGDTAEPKRTAYAGKLAQLIADLRADLNAPDAPFVLGQLGPFRSRKNSGNAAMNAVLAAFPATHPNTACVSSEGTTSIGDDLHFDAASLRELGRRYAAAYLQLAGKPAPATRPATPPATAAQANPTTRTVSAWTAKAKPKEFATRLLEDLPGFEPGAPVELTRYGGWKGGKPLAATGFFRAERVGPRWWLVDPDGYRFIHVGVTSVNAPRRTAVAKAAFDAKFGTTERWAEATRQLLFLHGFNGTGSWSTDADLQAAPAGARRPVYTRMWNFMSAYGRKRGGTFQEPGHTGYPNKCIFAFDPEFETFCDEHAKQLAATKDDPYLLGHYSDNELPFPLDALDRFLKLPETDPGRAAAERVLKDRNRTTADIADDDRQAFVEVLAERYFSVVSKAIRKYDPNHLFLGPRFWSTDHRNPALWRAAGRHADVVAYNLYGVWSPKPENLRRWEQMGGRPVLITEFYAKGDDTGMPNVSGAGWTVATQRDRGWFYQTFALGLLESRACVGWHWFKYADNDPDDTSTDPSNRDSNKGIVTREFEPYAPLLEEMRELNRAVYPLTTYFDGDAAAR